MKPDKKLLISPFPNPLLGVGERKKFIFIKSILINMHAALEKRISQ